MVQYVLIGLALGSIYAIASASLVVTFVSAGVLNFAFGSMAYFVARFYYWLNSQHGWQTWTAGIVSIVGVGPLLGVALYFSLFQFIRGKSTLVKLVATIGVSVALASLTTLIFGTQSIDSAPGLAALGDQLHPYHFLGTTITSDQVITYGFLVFVVVAGTAVLRLTQVGLKVRALVDSEAMASLSGTNPGRVAVGVWAVSAGLAGLAGILVAPTQGLDAPHMTALMSTAFAAVIVARLRSLSVAVAASFAMGIATDVIQPYISTNSIWYTAVLPSIPFLFILAAIVFYLLRSGALDEGRSVAGPLDLAIRPASRDAEGVPMETTDISRVESGLGLVPLVIVAALPLIFHGSALWLGLVAGGLCYAITFLSFTLVTGEGGMLWLSQIIFAGAGALSAGQFVTIWHVPVLLAVLMGGLLAALAGALIGLLTIRLGDLYVALVTLTFGLLVETLIFSLNRFTKGGPGIPLNRPGFASSDFKFAYLALAVFVVFALLTVNLRRSTTGLALRAVRDSEPAARTLGLSVLQVKVIVGALAAFVAAVGGGFLAMYSQVAQPLNYVTFLGLAWLAVVVTLGVRSITGAALAGMSFSLLPGVFTSYVPARWGDVPNVLFGLGALGVARNPEGVVAQNARQLRRLLARLLPGSSPGMPDSGPEIRSEVAA